MNYGILPFPFSCPCRFPSISSSLPFIILPPSLSFALPLFLCLSLLFLSCQFSPSSYLSVSFSLCLCPSQNSFCSPCSFLGLSNQYSSIHTYIHSIPFSILLDSFYNFKIKAFFLSQWIPNSKHTRVILLIIVSFSNA